MSESAHQAIHEWYFDLYDRMLGDVEISAVLTEVVNVVRDQCRAERATIYLVDEATASLDSIAVIGNVARRIRVPIRETSLAGFCATRRKAFVVPDAYGDLSAIDPRLRFDATWDQLNHFRTRDVLCAPATFKGDLLGVVQVCNALETPFSQTDLPEIGSISRLIGYALYHAKLYDDLATMKRLEQEKAAFMRVMVHELKSPIAAAKMLADTIPDAGDAGPQSERLAGRVSQRMAQMQQLVSDLLDLAHVKSGQLMSEVAIVDLGTETATTCETYREQADRKGLAFNVLTDPQAVPVRIDVQGCRLMLSNLISNAVKYTPAGKVEVAVRRTDERAVLTVSDTGMGIPEKDVPRLFAEFFRASNAKKSNVPGSGVGLAGVKQIVERFDGEMELQTAENAGTTFTVRLPLAQAAQDAVSGSVRRSSGS